MQTRHIRLAGAMLAAGAITWAVTALVAPSTSTHSTRLELAGGLAFQIGLACYLAVVARLRAAGDGWGQRIVLAEGVVLLLAAVWSVGAVVAPPHVHEGSVMAALDAAWPLSMVGLVAVGSAVARAGRLTGPTRWAPLVTSFWLVADGVGQAVSSGQTTHEVIHTLWLLGPYGWLATALLAGLPGRRPGAIEEVPPTPVAGISLAGHDALRAGPGNDVAEAYTG